MFSGLADDVAKKSKMAAKKSKMAAGLNELKDATDSLS
jgi:hypothetical protein